MQTYKQYTEQRVTQELVESLGQQAEIVDWLEANAARLTSEQVRGFLLEGNWGKRIGQVVGGLYGAAKGAIPPVVGGLTGLAFDAATGFQSPIPNSVTGAVAGGIVNFKDAQKDLEMGIRKGGIIGDRATDWMKKKLGFQPRAKKEHLEQLSLVLTQLSSEQKQQIVRNLN